MMIDAWMTVNKDRFCHVFDAILDPTESLKQPWAT